MVLTLRASSQADRIAEYVGANYSDYDDPGCEAAIRALCGFYAYTHSLSDADADIFHYCTYLRCGSAMAERGC